MNYRFDDDLREVFVEIEDPHPQLTKLRESADDLEPLERARALGEIGVYLRIARRLDEAQTALEESLRLFKLYGNSPAAEFQQELRLAHVHQWKGAFDRSNEMFTELMARCSANDALGSYLDFVWQHIGKNYFDQRQFVPALLAFENAQKLRVARQAPTDQLESTEHALRVTKSKLGFPINP